MSGLAKATLREIKADGSGTPQGDPIPVQFNPGSLRLQLANRNEGGESRGRQARQHLGSSSSTLSLELHFDTADEGTTDRPRSVREKTRLVEKYVLPQGQGETKQAPPRVRFQWGDFILDGVIENIDIDFDHFAPSGVPLRAKVSLSIKEQDPKFEFPPLQAGAGANQAGGAPDPGSAAAGGAPNRTAAALGGEAAVEFAARMGLDPGAWRGLGLGLEASLSLEAGLEIDFNAGLSAGVGLGLTAGVAVGASLSLEASFGLEAGAGIAARAAPGLGASAQTAAGLALSAAGGVSAAITTVQARRAEAAATETKRAFAPTLALPPAAAPPRAARPPQPRPPLARSGIPDAAAARPAPAAPPPPAPDPRAVSFGYGVPLRPRQRGAADSRAAAVAGAVVLRPERGPEAVSDPGAPAWERLPTDAGRRVADRTQRTRRPPCRCSCGQGPRPRGEPSCRCTSRTSRAK